MKPTLLTIAIAYRSAQLYAHNAHHLVAGPSFFGDHPYLGGLYGTYEDTYDKLVEHLLGLGAKPDLWDAQVQAAAVLSGLGTDVTAADFFRRLLTLEKGIFSALNAVLAEEGDSGTQNLLQDLQTQSQARMYQLGQRTK